MKGYSTLKQFVHDYKIYLIAKKIDPGRLNEKTVTAYLKENIKKRMDSASKNFKDMLKKNNYSKDDLILIATHDIIDRISNLDDFIKECYSVKYVDDKKYKKVLSSNAFKSGRLKVLYSIIPKSIETKHEFFRFLKGRGHITKNELSTIMNYICKEKWANWLYELIDKQRVVEREGRYMT